MKNNKKGLSTIVATLLIILLTLVAVGIIWVVIRGVVDDSTTQLDVDAKCLAASVEVTKVTTDADSHDVTIVRSGGDDVLGGVKIILTASDGTANHIVDVPVTDVDPLPALGAKTIVVLNSTMGALQYADINKASVVVYFLDESNNQQLCSTANQYSF